MDRAGAPLGEARLIDDDTGEIADLPGLAAGRNTDAKSGHIDRLTRALPATIEKRTRRVYSQARQGYINAAFVRWQGDDVAAMLAPVAALTEEPTTRKKRPPQGAAPECPPCGGTEVVRSMVVLKRTTLSCAECATVIERIEEPMGRPTWQEPHSTASKGTDPPAEGFPPETAHSGSCPPELTPLRTDEPERAPIGARVPIQINARVQTPQGAGRVTRLVAAIGATVRLDAGRLDYYALADLTDEPAQAPLWGAAG